MSFKINKYDKSTELFQRAAKVIPSGLYGHQGPAEDVSCGGEAALGIDEQL